MLCCVVVGCRASAWVYSQHVTGRAAGGLLDSVGEWLLQRADLWDLARAASPCTSSIGSAKVAAALQDLGAAHGLAGLRVWRLLGLSDADDPAEHPERLMGIG